MKQAEFLKVGSQAVIQFIKAAGRPVSYPEVAVELDRLALTCRSFHTLQLLYAMSIHGTDLRMSGPRGSERWSLE